MKKLLFALACIASIVASGVMAAHARSAKDWTDIRADRQSACFAQAWCMGEHIETNELRQYLDRCLAGQIALLPRTYRSCINGR